MDLTVKAFDTGLTYQFAVSDGTDENTFVYEFTKQPPEGVEVADYLQNCKNESLALAQWEITQRQPVQELTI